VPEAESSFAAVAGELAERLTSVRVPVDRSTRSTSLLVPLASPGKRSAAEVWKTAQRPSALTARAVTWLVPWPV
jgi:hypothetical protein